MPLSKDAYPGPDDNGNVVVYDPSSPGGVGIYKVDPNTGFVLMPEGPVNPDWNNPAKYGGKFAPSQPQQAAPGVRTNPTAPAMTPAIPTPAATTPKSGITPNIPNMPGVDVQPGLTSQQWEAQYNLALAQEKRLRELMGTVTQPQARAAIDQAIQAIQQSRYTNRVSARDTQTRETGMIPQWLPQPPKVQAGGWKQYQTGGLVAPPGDQTTPNPSTPTPGTPAAIPSNWEGQAKLIINFLNTHPGYDPNWDSFIAQHPDMKDASGPGAASSYGRSLNYYGGQWDSSRGRQPGAAYDTSVQKQNKDILDLIAKGQV